MRTAAWRGAFRFERLVSVGDAGAEHKRRLFHLTIGLSLNEPKRTSNRHIIFCEIIGREHDTTFVAKARWICHLDAANLNQQNLTIWLDKTQPIANSERDSPGLSRNNDNTFATHAAEYESLCYCACENCALSLAHHIQLPLYQIMMAHAN